MAIFRWPDERLHAFGEVRDSSPDGVRDSAPPVLLIRSSGVHALGMGDVCDTSPGEVRDSPPLLSVASDSEESGPCHPSLVGMQA